MPSVWQLFIKCLRAKVLDTSKGEHPVGAEKCILIYGLILILLMVDSCFDKKDRPCRDWRIGGFRSDREGGDEALIVLLG